MTRGVYPGTFNPPTIGHLSLVEAALEHHRLHSLTLVLSRRPLAKDAPLRPRWTDRLRVVEESVAHLPRVSIEVTDKQLIAEIAEGYDVLVMGADKWAQVHDPAFYADLDERDAAVAGLPRLAIADRAPTDGHTAVPIPAGAELSTAVDVSGISSSAARRGAVELMTPAARAFDELTGAWSDPQRYDRWRRSLSHPDEAAEAQ